MSVARTLLRLAREVRREAKRNPEFAARLDAVFQAHESQRELPDALIEEVKRGDDVVETESEAPPPPDLNPVGLFAREGADGLKAALIDNALDAEALRALILEHNLDPGGEAEDLDRAALVAHIVATAERRVQRDRKMFDY